jgi:hypothetical protein
MKPGIQSWVTSYESLGGRSDAGVGFSLSFFSFSGGHIPTISPYWEIRDIPY